MDINRKNMLVMVLFPNATKANRRVLRELADAKGVDWLSKNISVQLHDLMGSILRHNATHYEGCIHAAGRERARFYVQGEVTRLMNHLKGI